MLEIRKHPNITSSVHISDLNLKLPTSGEWLSLARFSPGVLEESVNLKTAFEQQLIELKIPDGDYSAVPSWLMRSYASFIRVPTEILDQKEEVVLAEVARLRIGAHPMVEYLIISGLLRAELVGKQRTAVTKALLSYISSPMAEEE